MIESILVWLATQILNYLLGLATKAVTDAADQMALDNERNETNDANTKAYDQALDRKSRIDAATSLLNRTSVSGQPNP